MRGKASGLESKMQSIRITPAYAGKSENAGGRCRRLKDHPRLCGEKISTFASGVVASGSPPPMRGKAELRIDFMEHCMDHPRLCGEKRTWFNKLFLVSGSPPPMRGKAGKNQAV